MTSNYIITAKHRVVADSTLKAVEEFTRIFPHAEVIQVKDVGFLIREGD